MGESPLPLVLYTSFLLLLGTEEDLVLIRGFYIKGFLGRVPPVFDHINNQKLYLIEFIFQLIFFSVKILIMYFTTELDLSECF